MNDDVSASCECHILVQTWILSSIQNKFYENHDFQFLSYVSSNPDGQWIENHKTYKHLLLRFVDACFLHEPKSLVLIWNPFRKECKLQSNHDPALGLSCVLNSPPNLSWRAGKVDTTSNGFDPTESLSLQREIGNRMYRLNGWNLLLKMSEASVKLSLKDISNHCLVLYYTDVTIIFIWHLLLRTEHRLVNIERDLARCVQLRLW